MALNSPESLSLLWKVATAPQVRKTHEIPAVVAADFMREVALKCISFTGIPRTILALTGMIDDGIPSRHGHPIEAWQGTSRTGVATNKSEDLSLGHSEQGMRLWSSVYAPPVLSQKLLEKLRKAHPQLPVVILEGHYGQLLSDPPNMPPDIRVGRALTSVAAVAALRAQGGVAPQVTSHIRGLQNAVIEAQQPNTKDGSGSSQAQLKAAPADKLQVDPEEVEGMEWLATDEGSIWLLQSIDSIAICLRGDAYQRESTAEVKSKL